MSPGPCFPLNSARRLCSRLWEEPKSSCFLFLFSLSRKTDTSPVQRFHKVPWCAVCCPSSSSVVAQSCPTLGDPMGCSTAGLPALHSLLELAQTPVHRVGDAIQPSHPLSPPSPPVLNSFLYFFVYLKHEKHRRVLWRSLVVVYMTVLLNQTSTGCLRWTFHLIFGLQVPSFDLSDHPCLG